MNLVQLEYARAVAESGSFSEAARARGVSQPTISNAVSELEEELGARLFSRTTRSVAPTAFGRELLASIGGVLDSVGELKQRARALLDPDRKLVRVAFSPIVDTRRLMALFEPFRQDNPGVEIIYKECNSGELGARLESEQVDVICGVMLAGSKSRRNRVLYQDVLRYIPRGGAGTGSPKISLEDIARDTLILTLGVCGLAPLTRELFRRAGVKVREYPGQAVSYQVLQEWASLGIGGAIVPESRIIGNAAAFPVVAVGRGSAIITYEAAWDRNAASPPHLKAFRSYLMDVAGPVKR
ncbi:hypothetical protein BWI17_01890 [Betaproteobacteria bacterium GR16-43]|nr:hypothetical protein BWI17_01890 [Betaproteobacteria bacterium GR16-43]